MNLPEYVTLNGTRYTSSKLPQEALMQLGNIQVVDIEIARLQQQLGIAQTARNAYTSAFAQALKSSDAKPKADTPVSAPASASAPVKKASKPRKPKAA